MTLAGDGLALMYVIAAFVPSRHFSLTKGAWWKDGSAIATENLAGYATDARCYPLVRGNTVTARVRVG